MMTYELYMPLSLRGLHEALISAAAADPDCGLRVPIDEMANWVTRAGDLVGVGFMNPSYMIKMVQVIRGPRTSEAAMAGVAALLESLGGEACRSSALLLAKVCEGNLGRKTGRGFYDYGRVA